MSDISRAPLPVLVLLLPRAVIQLLPRLAAFAPERFAQDYLHKCIAHLLAVLKHTGERGSSFAALADMASSLAAVGCQEGFEPYLPAIAAQVCTGGPGFRVILAASLRPAIIHTLMTHCLTQTSRWVVTEEQVKGTRHSICVLHQPQCVCNWTTRCHVH